MSTIKIRAGRYHKEINDLEKENLSKVEEFAKEIIQMASEKGLTVSELREAAYLAKRIANESAVEITVIEKSFPVQEKRNYSGAFDWR